MPRILRTTLPDGFFHITSRGVEQRAIYLDAEDCRSFLTLFGSTARRHRWDLYAFCLMTNHYHAVFEATREDLSDGVQHLNGVYAQRFNSRYERWGHLFGGRFRSWVIDSEDYLYHASRYVLANPVRARPVEHAESGPGAIPAGASGWNETAISGEKRTCVRSEGAAKLAPWRLASSSSTAPASTT